MSYFMVFAVFNQVQLTCGYNAGRVTFYLFSQQGNVISYL